MRDKGRDRTQFERKAAELLDESVAGLDANIASRLHQARSLALESRPVWLQWPAWTGAGALAAGLASVFLLMDMRPLETGSPTLYEDAVQQATAESLELMDELDFLAWLAMQEGGADYESDGF